VAIHDPTSNDKVQQAIWLLHRAPSSAPPWASDEVRLRHGVAAASALAGGYREKCPGFAWRDAGWRGCAGRRSTAQWAAGGPSCCSAFVSPEVTGMEFELQHAIACQAAQRDGRTEASGPASESTTFLPGGEDPARKIVRHALARY